MSGDPPKARVNVDPPDYTKRPPKRGGKVGLLELQSLWPFPRQTVREKCEGRSHVLVVEMNMGQIFREVKSCVSKPNEVYLANRFDGVFISHMDISRVLNVLLGKGV